MYQSRCRPSSSSCVGSRSADAAYGPMCSGRKMLAATALALSVCSVSAFSPPPLHPVSRRIRSDGRRCGRDSSLSMALTDPDTLLWEELYSRDQSSQHESHASPSSRLPQNIGTVSASDVYVIGSSSELQRLSSSLERDLNASGQMGMKTDTRRLKAADAASSVIDAKPLPSSLPTATKSTRPSVDTNVENNNIVDTGSMRSFAGPIVEDEPAVSSKVTTRAVSSGQTQANRTMKSRGKITTKKLVTSAVGNSSQVNTKKRVSRSSTMPGFNSRRNTKRQRAHRDGIKIVEERSGKKIGKIVNTDANRRKRRKENSVAMYKSSASVPDSLIQFTNEIHEEERITPTEEIQLGEKTQEAIKLQRMYENLELELNREPTDAEYCAAAGKINMEAIQQAIDDGMEAKNQLVTSNLRMVQGVVNLYIRNGLGSQYNAGDLMQEGTMALIRAAEKFEPQRGFRFSTYAMYWIRAAVKRSQILQSRVVAIPQRMHETHKRIVKVEKELKQELGRKPTSSELALASGVTEVQLERCLTAVAQRCYSLDAEVVNTLKPESGDKKDSVADLIGQKVAADDEQKMMQRLFIKEDLIETLRRYLTPPEVDLLLLRYGLMDERTLPHGFSGPLTIAEVSRLVGLKPDKVRRMINSSLRQLRHLIAHEWEDFEAEML